MTSPNSSLPRPAAETAPQGPDLFDLYALMLEARLFEVAVTRLWDDGLISGEMHLGTGEEAIVAGIVPQLRADDALALDHRGTSAMLMRGVDPVLLLREFLGHPDGLCAGQGGHMHLFSREHLAASSGIVGASGPAAAGFALAAQYLRPGSVAVAFFGEGAVNAGMLLESLNLAVAWNLPVIFVCKDDGWSIATDSPSMTGGTLEARAHGFGMSYVQADGRVINRVWTAAAAAIERARAGGGPTFLHIYCVHLEAHLLGYPLLRNIRQPLREVPQLAFPFTRALVGKVGGSLRARLAGFSFVLRQFLRPTRDPRRRQYNDPVAHTRAALLSDPARLAALEEEVEKRVAAAVDHALHAEAPG